MRQSISQAVSRGALSRASKSGAEFLPQRRLKGVGRDQPAQAVAVFQAKAGKFGVGGGFLQHFAAGQRAVADGPVQVVQQPAEGMSVLPAAPGSQCKAGSRRRPPQRPAAQRRTDTAPPSQRNHPGRHAGMAAAFQQHRGGEGAGVQQPGQLGAAFQVLDAVAVDRRQEHHAGSSPASSAAASASVPSSSQTMAWGFMQRSAMQDGFRLGVLDIDVAGGGMLSGQPGAAAPKQLAPLVHHAEHMVSLPQVADHAAQKGRFAAAWYAGHQDAAGQIRQGLHHPAQAARR